MKKNSPENGHTGGKILMLFMYSIEDSYIGGNPNYKQGRIQCS